MNYCLGIYHPAETKLGMITVTFIQAITSTSAVIRSAALHPGSVIFTQGHERKNVFLVINVGDLAALVKDCDVWPPCCYLCHCVLQITTQGAPVLYWTVALCEP